MDFPANCGVIIGANFLAQHKVDIILSKWLLMHNGFVLQPLNPSRVNGQLLSHSDRDYFENSLEPLYSLPGAEDDNCAGPQSAV